MGASHELIFPWNDVGAVVIDIELLFADPLSFQDFFEHLPIPSLVDFFCDGMFDAVHLIHKV